MAKHQQIEKLENRVDVSSLEEKISEMAIIKTGIGIIRYEVEGSLTLVQLMETLAEVIKEQGATAVLRHLEETFAV